MSSLPAELEHQIFRLSAVSYPILIPNLLRVAWRVKEWVEPLLYRTLVIGGSRYKPSDDIPPCNMAAFTRIVHTKSPAFLRDAVRNVMLCAVMPADLITVVSACAGIENLWVSLRSFDYPQQASSALAALPLKHLYCNIEEVFESHGLDPFNPWPLMHITHLELFQLPFDLETDDAVGGAWTRLGDLPNLTHLAVDQLPSSTVCTRVLDVCKSLQTFAVLVSAVGWWDTLSITTGPLADNPRFLIVHGMDTVEYLADWRLGILTGNDYWARADEFLAKRREGEIDRKPFVPLSKFLRTQFVQFRTAARLRVYRHLDRLQPRAARHGDRGNHIPTRWMTRPALRHPCDSGVGVGEGRRRFCEAGDAHMGPKKVHDGGDGDIMRKQVAWPSGNGVWRLRQSRRSATPRRRRMRLHADFETLLSPSAGFMPYLPLASQYGCAVHAHAHIHAGAEAPCLSLVRSDAGASSGSDTSHASSVHGGGRVTDSLSYPRNAARMHTP
ncbi:hypothetical protein GGX14DRAFT_596300 [Mycena pura]|uniref:F-box domain-containing protein n=1 Tax=Mycena pura TaxID=153505 RepID=A0AAD6USU3_9AGAR|nr:hypothetical protein GGX14DRAFT_596300 [Mycena pura]